MSFFLFLSRSFVLFLFLSFSFFLFLCLSLCITKCLLLHPLSTDGISAAMNVATPSGSVNKRPLAAAAASREEVNTSTLAHREEATLSSPLSGYYQSAADIEAAAKSY